MEDEKKLELETKMEDEKIVEIETKEEKKPEKKKLSSRKKKNIAMIVAEVLLIAAIVFTSGVIKFGKAGDMPQGGQQGGQPPQMSQEQSDSSESGENAESSESDSSDNSKSESANSDQQTPPEKPSGDAAQTGDGQTPPEMPSGDNAQQPSGDAAQSGDGQTPPEMPSGDNAQSGDGQTPPEMPSGDNAQSGDGQTPPEMPSGDNAQQPGGGNGQQPSGMPGGLSTVKIILICVEALVFALILIYLLMSRFNKKTFKETLDNKKRILAFIIASVVTAAGISAAVTILPMKLMSKNMPQGQMGQGGNNGGEQSDSSSAEASGANVVDGEEKELNGEYSSKTADENVILVKNGGSLNSDGATITKTSGDGSNTDNCDFYGINAGLLVNSKSSATIKNATITTKADKSNAVFCTGEGSSINISDSTITTTGKSSCRGLDATYGGSITADNVTISTKGGSCATLATDRGEGTVTVTNSELKTEGAGSPLIYSTGNISVTKTEGTAEGSQLVVVEGKNSATVKNSKLTAEGTGNRGDVDVCGVMLYQSMSGDADEGTSSFVASGSTLSIDEKSNYYDTAPMFFVTNTDAVIKLTNNTLNFGSGILLNAQGTSEWGETDNNGGSVSLTATKQALTGDIILDKLSTLKFSLKSGSSYEGTINGDKKAKSVELSLSKDSKIVLTGDSYVSSLENEDSSNSNIDFNGHKLYVDGKAIN